MVEMGTAALAKRLGVSHRRVNDLVRTGRIVATKTDSGAWRVTIDSAASYEARRSTTRGLTVDAAWALLFLLDGQTANWVSDSTRARLRQRIRRSTDQQLARAVANRTRAHGFRAANAERAAQGLLLTGRAAADRLNTNLLSDRRHVQGYPPADTTVQDWARGHFMIADESGADLLYDNTLPNGIRHTVTAMPDAVLAADLAVSHDIREQRAGLTVLSEIQSAWLRRHG